MDDAPRELSDEERLDWLRLWRSENIGPRAFSDLLQLTGSAGTALERLPEFARRGGLRRKVVVCSRGQAERERDRLAAAGGRLLASCEPDYPRPLAAIADPPPIISVVGRAALLRQDMIAVVGARNASGAGGRFARGLAAELGKAGYAVVSGLARGIDSQAHLGALKTGTAAVVAGGVDVVYPPENDPLYRQIADTGAVLSEQPFGARPTARHFPRRNRIISGLSLGVVVVEAMPRSGSLITARVAAEQGREVFAVPGSPLDPRHRGTNGLLRDGAVLTESVADIVDALGPRLVLPLAAPAPPLPAAPGDGLPAGGEDARRATVLGALSPTPVGIDELVRQCHLPASEVMVIILELELAGRLVRNGSGAVSAAA